MSNLPKDVILSHIDFAKNYTFQIGNEIQSMHWHSFQVTILVHITYRLNITYNPFYSETNSETKVIKQSHFYVSNDKEHDALFVQHWEWLVRQGLKPRKHWVFFDNCASQFKGVSCIFLLLSIPVLQVDAN
jgi:hypothetical protein